MLVRVATVLIIVGIAVVQMLSGASIAQLLGSIVLTMVVVAAIVKISKLAESKDTKGAAHSINVKANQAAQSIDQVPSEVAQLAEAVGMGRLLHAQNAMTPGRFFSEGAVVAAAIIGGAFALAWFANLSKNNGLGDAASEFAKYALMGIVCGIVVFLMAIRSLFIGHRSAYLYDNGIIWRRNRRIEPVCWSRMSELIRWRMNSDILPAGEFYYVLITVDGLRLQIPYFDANGGNSFVVKLEDKIRSRGGRIVEGGPYFQLGKPILPLSQEFIVLLVLGCMYAVGKLLILFGIPSDAAVAQAPLLVGLTVLAVELRTRRPLAKTSALVQAPFGQFFAGIGGLWFAWAVGLAYGSPIGWTILAMEIVIYALAVRLTKARALDQVRGASEPPQAMLRGSKIPGTSRLPRESDSQFPTWGCIFFACMGIFCLYCVYSLSGSEVDCGGRTMSPDQTCITTSISGSSSWSSTNNYTEQRKQNEREKFALTLGGIGCLLAGVGPIIARARRKSAQNPDREYSQTKTRQGDDHRSFLDVTLGETIDNIWGYCMRSASSPAYTQKNDVIEVEFKNIFFNRTSADRERIISHWMTARSVSRSEAMRLAIEDWRKDNCRAG